MLTAVLWTFQIHKSLCGPSATFLVVKPGGAYNNDWVSNQLFYSGKYICTTWLNIKRLLTFLIEGGNKFFKSIIAHSNDTPKQLVFVMEKKYVFC